MPLCFDLTRKGETKPTALNKLDEEFCQLLAQPVHKTDYVFGWFDFIGFRLAEGKNYDEIAVDIQERRKELIARYDQLEDKDKSIRMLEAVNEIYGGYERILEYMRENYTPNSWFDR